MKIMIDTNVLLDVLLEREEFLQDSLRVLQFCNTNLVEGHILSLSLANIFYYGRKRFGLPKTYQALNGLRTLLVVDDMSAADCQKAIEMGWRDYEDCIHCLSAKRNGCDYIVTRNAKDFTNSPIPAVTPTEFLGIQKRLA